MVSKLHSVLKGVFGQTGEHIDALHSVTEVAAETAMMFQLFAKKSGDRSQARTIHNGIVSLERHADQLQKDAVFKVSHALLLPFDRSHLFRLLNRADDIIDNIRKVSSRATLYEMTFTSEMNQMVDFVHRAILILNSATPLMKNVSKNAADLTSAAAEVRELEHKADAIHMNILSELLVNHDQSSHNQSDINDPRVAKHFIPSVFAPMRECVDRIEKAMDSCKHYAEAIELVVTDNA